VIADQQKALALAGIMGGDDSAVSETVDILLESAFFQP
jgi:phenylalanyl-tRNA synthetase beta chain